MAEPVAWTVACAVGVVVTLAGERYSSWFVSVAGKLIAASSYVAAAWTAGAADTLFGQILLLGMAFCWMGDLFLVSNQSRTLFLLGLTSFLLGHLAYIGAFAARGVSLPIALCAGLVMTVFAWRVLRWLRPHLDERMRRPVWLYVMAISTMMAMAAGAYPLDKNGFIPLGALLFLLSDLAVARDRFIAPGFINRAWGLPMYFGGQIVLAWSVGYA